MQQVRIVKDMEKSHNIIIDLLIALCSSLLLFLSFHPVDCGVLAWFALAPWLYIVQTNSPRRAAKISCITGLLFFFAGLWWLGIVSIVGLIISCAILSAFTAIFGFMSASVISKYRVSAVIVFPVFWVAVEYARSNLFVFSFPWLLLAHTQHNYIKIIQICDTVGVYGLSFLMVFFNAFLVELILYIRSRAVTLKRIVIEGIAAVVLLLLTFIYGNHCVKSIELHEGPRIYCVQGNIPQDLKEESLRNIGKLAQKIIADHMALTIPALYQNVDLIVWPETMYPSFLLLQGEDLLRFSQIAKESKASVLVGSQHYEIENGKAKRYNSAIYINPDGMVAGRYDKLFLVLVGEYIPFEKALPLLGYIISSFIPYECESLSEGSKMKIFSLKDYSFACVICFELSLDWLVRKAAVAGADFIVNISNDAWFEGSSELDLARAHAAFRAVENRVSVVRVVNRGISCIADPLGRIKDLEVKGKRKNVEGTFIINAMLSDSKSAYLSIGNLFGKIIFFCGAACVIFLIVTHFRRRWQSPVT
ncbi:MAG: apolipoprotein N-acyltransferase [Planctomycetota bacterium]